MEVTQHYGGPRPVQPQKPAPLPEINHPNLSTAPPEAQDLYTDLALPFKVTRFKDPNGFYDYVRIQADDGAGHLFGMDTKDSRKYLVQPVLKLVEMYAEEKAVRTALADKVKDLEAVIKGLQDKRPKAKE